jgi:hypothetical protein
LSILLEVATNISNLHDRCDVIKRGTFSINYIPLYFENLINIEE